MGNLIAHMELPVTDLNKAKEFYSKLFGWKVGIVPQMNVGLFDTDASQKVWGSFGGFIKVDKVKEGGAAFYIEVEDIEKKLKEIEKAGGKTLQKKTRIPIGWTALFKDIFGNVLALSERTKEKV